MLAFFGRLGAGFFGGVGPTVAAAGGGASGPALLMETSDYILLESGSFLLLE